MSPYIVELVVLGLSVHCHIYTQASPGNIHTSYSPSLQLRDIEYFVLGSKLLVVLYIFFASITTLLPLKGSH